MVKTRRKEYSTRGEDGETNDEKRTKTTMEPATTREDSMASTAATISTKALQEILAESQKYASPPRPAFGITSPGAIGNMTYQHTPIAQRGTPQPRFGSPITRYAYTCLSTATATIHTPTITTPILGGINVQTATGDPFATTEDMVTVGYKRSTTDPNQWEPVQITLDEF